MTTTELHSGIAGKNSSRVLRPPGGGSSNIFGNQDERPQQHVQAAPAPDQNRNQGGSAEAAAQQQNQDRQQGGQKQFKNRDFDPAPFASFTESGKKSDPTQFDDCSRESQNDADFRSYSVTAYREAIATNAAVRQRARGSAAGSTNPITHEDSQPSPFKNYEQSRVHPQHVQQQQQHQNQERTTGKRAHNTQRRGQYNPITGEEYTDGFGANEEKEGVAEENEEQDKDEPIDTTEEKEEPKPSPQEKPADAPKDHNSYLVKKVRHPPGGASSGLW